MTRMRHLPHDIIVEILHRLPVKALMRFKCINKSWCSLISRDRLLAKVHLQHATSKNQHRILLFPSLINGKNMNSDAITLSAVDCTLIKTQKLSFDYDNLLFSGPGVFGLCDGLIWLCLDRHYVLWNPSTRVYKELPEHDLPPIGMSCAFKGLGYDSSIDDYKLVIGRVYRGKDDSYAKIKQVEVYTLNTSAWRTIELAKGYRTTSKILNWDFGPYFNGALHWLMYSHHDWPIYTIEGILSFNLVEETFQQIPLPPLTNKGFYNLRADVLGDCICVVLTERLSRLEDGDYMIELWMLKDYNVTSSWTKLVVSLPLKRYGYENINVVHLFLSKANEVVVVIKVAEELRAYNLQDNTWRTMFVLKDHSFETVTYIESLVSPYGLGGT